MVSLEALVPLFAFDWNPEVIVIVVALVLWALNQLFGQEKEAPKPQRRRAPQAGGKPAGGAQSDEIDRFLREIATRRQAGQKQAPEMEVLRPQTVERSVRRPVPPGRRRQTTSAERRFKPLKPETPEPRSIKETRRPLAETHIETSVDDHVREHLASDIAQHVQEHLGAQPLGQQAAPPAQSRLVGGGLGALAPSLGSQVKKTIPGGSTAGLAALLRSGVGLRQAVVLTEIFGPPRSRRPIR